MLQSSPIFFKGRFRVEHYDKEGTLKATYRFPNGIVDEGINHNLDVMFASASQEATWYLGLIDDINFTSLNPSDDLGNHSGWDETQLYDNAARPTWVNGAAVSRSMTNAATSDFSINANVTLRGIFVTADGVKASVDGILWSTALFGSVVSAVDGDSLKITYTVSG